jgi:hypothetical protein
MRGAVALVTLALGCGRWGFDPLARDGGDDSGADASCTWGPFESPMVVATLADLANNDVWEPSLTGDELEAFTASAGPHGKEDLWHSMRTTRSDAFGAALVIDELSGPELDGAPQISPDGLTLVFSRERVVNVDLDLYIAKRANPDPMTLFSTPMAIAELNTTYNDEGPWLSPDGLHIYFASQRPPSAGDYELWWASRANAAAAFDAPLQLIELSSSFDERMPRLSPDELEIYFASDRANGSGQFDLWRANRTAIGQTFGAPTNLSALNTTTDDWAPFITHDGASMYYNRAASVDGSGTIRAQVWLTTRSCQ